MSAVLDRLRCPVVAAPMAGGPTTPELVAAVGEAGGLGLLAAGYQAADQVAADIAAVRRLTAAPFGVNVLLPGPPAPDRSAVDAYARRLAGEASRLGVELGEPRHDDDRYPDKLALLAEQPVAVVTTAFGLPPAADVARLRDAGSEVWVTITRPGDAAEAVRRGADALVLQGSEAGAHRGGGDDTDDWALLPLLRLVAADPAVAGVPLVATGGLADGAGIAAVLAAGARAAQLGTAFLRCPEAGTSPTHRAALARAGETRLTRAFTGRRARGIVNRFLAEHDAEAPVGYPDVHHVTAPLRAAARAAGDADALHLWAGQAYPLGAELPAGELVRRLTDDALTALQDATVALSSGRSGERPGL